MILFEQSAEVDVTDKFAGKIGTCNLREVKGEIFLVEIVLMLDAEGCGHEIRRVRRTHEGCEEVEGIVVNENPCG